MANTQYRCRVYVQGIFFPNKISGVGTIFGLLLHVLPGPNKQRARKQVRIWAEFCDKRIRPAASFVLGIQFANSYFCDSRCPFGQIDNRKHMLGRFRSHFQTNCWHVDLKRASRPFGCCKLDLMGHRWLKVMAIENFSPNEILMLIFELPYYITRFWT